MHDAREYYMHRWMFAAIVFKRSLCSFITYADCAYEDACESLNVCVFVAVLVDALKKKEQHAFGDVIFFWFFSQFEYVLMLSRPLYCRVLTLSGACKCMHISYASITSGRMKLTKFLPTDQSPWTPCNLRLCCDCWAKSNQSVGKCYNSLKWRPISIQFWHLSRY